MAVKIKADFWFENTGPNSQVKHVKGDVVECSPDVEVWLLATGIAVEPGAETKPVETKPVEVKPVKTEPVEQPETDSRMPYKSASIDEWRAYAKSRGVDITGLKSKAKIIAAVKQ